MVEKYLPKNNAEDNIKEKTQKQKGKEDELGSNKCIHAN